ncbi:SDR family NAD(P)-dependent oxidoreductase [Mesorhizobium sp. CAU 1732]|uniref:SDR family NAD(P)-dependent oxidoreductase n=1 Tax=Mesorhizobium sp. CAU 1732 TaxID=3140358 RepID=UPI003260E150
MNSYDFAGQHAVVTGGASGIGAAVAYRLALSGARVAIWDMNTQKLDSKLGEIPDEQLLVVQVDVSNPDAVAKATQQTSNAFGKVDVLINSAGVPGPAAKLVDYKYVDWRKVHDVNLDGTFLPCQAIVPLMVERNYGRIVNIASVAGKEGNPNASGYSSSKAAVIGMTKALGKELAGHDIAVNAVTPATADTPILERVPQEFIDYMLSKIPRGRFVTVEEIASMVLWIASRENSFTTSAIFDLSGGRATY